METKCPLYEHPATFMFSDHQDMKLTIKIDCIHYCTRKINRYWVSKTQTEKTYNKNTSLSGHHMFKT